MLETLNGLRMGLMLTIVVILLLLTANFQSFRHAIIVLSSLPAAIVGVLLALLMTHTTLNVQSFLGAIMAMGVATANAILLVTFARARWMGGLSAEEAARDGAAGRLRPIVMTSGAMIMGMIPLALGLETGGEQTAPLGRAVIGGLFAAMLATLIILPCVFAWIHGQRVPRSPSLDPDDPAGHRITEKRHASNE
jgi:multidrug efflux pump subunit AcrB